MSLGHYLHSLALRRDGTSRAEWNASACTYKLNLALSCHVQAEVRIALHSWSGVLCWEQDGQKWTDWQVPGI